MKSFCLALGCCVVLAGSARAQPVATAAQNVPALTEAQKAAVASLRLESERKTTLMAVELAAVVQKIYDNNLSDTPNETLRATLETEMKDLVWQMLLVKGNAMWDAFRLLAPEQKRIVRTEIAKPRAPGDLPDVMDLIVRMFNLTGR